MKCSLVLTAIMICLNSISISAQLTLKQAAENKNKYIGTILNINFFNGENGTNKTAYRTIANKEFNAFVAENNFKSGFLLRGNNQTTSNDLLNLTIANINTSNLNKLMDWGTANNSIVRGHVLIWHSGLPTWFEAIASNWNDAEIRQFSAKYIELVMSYCRDYPGGNVDEWDVINEIISDNNPANYRQTYSNNGQNVDTWFKNVAISAGGQGYQSFIDFCFTTAKAIDPIPKLYYNDYNIEVYNRNQNSKNGFLRNMVKGMVERGIPIDGVGLQGHFVSGTMSQTQVDKVSLTMDYIIGLKEGMQSLITELDLRICGNESNLSTQAQEYERILEMALSKKNSPGLVFWGFTDKYSWILQFFDGCDDALLFNRNFSEKPSCAGVLNGINKVTTPTAQSPFNNSPFIINNNDTTVIPFTEFDNGGSGIAYFDDTKGQETNGTFRANENVDIAGSIVGFTEAGEWMEYTINVINAGVYDLTLNTTSEFAGKANFSINGNNISGTINTPNTGSFSTNYTNTTIPIPLEAGEQILRFTVEQGPINLQNISFSFNNTLAIVDLEPELEEQLELKLYPIPFKESFVITLETFKEAKLFKIFDLSGKMVYTQKHDGENIAEINPIGLQSGIYILSVDYKNEETGIFKILKN